MGCDSGSCDSGSCDSGSCGTNRGLPPGMLQAYKLNIDRSDGWLVWIELDRSGPEPVITEDTRRVLNKIRSINDGSRVWGVIFGHIELKPLYPEIYGLGVETLYEVHSKDLITYHPEAYASCLAQIIVRTEPAAVVFPHSPRAVELGARIAGLLDTGFVPRCNEITADARKMTFIHGTVADRVAALEVTTFPQIATLKTESLPEVPKSTAKGTVIYWQFDGCGLKDIL